jgi:AcrR family transcriptional regulator
VGAELFAQRGYAGVSVDDLGAAAGVSGPALYHHFDGKEAMLGEMLVGISESLLDRGQAIVAGEPAGRRLEGLIAMHVDFAVDDHDLITVHNRDLVHARPADQRRVRDLQGAYVDIWVAEVVARHPGLDARTARAAVHAVFGLINSTPHSGRLPRADLVGLLRTTAAGALAALA